MTKSAEQLALELKTPFPPELIHWRVGSTMPDKSKGMALAYIDARDVMKRLDDVCGIGGWQCRYPIDASGTLICEVGIKIGEEWIWKADGAGTTDYEGEKGKASDAFKRAAVRWGVGRYLYQLGNTWAPIQQKGKSYVIPKGSEPQLPAWATPEGFQKIMERRAA